MDNNNNINNDNTNRSKRGFAAMDENEQREIASKGGKAAHQSGNAHEFDSEEAREAGRKGGQARSNNSNTNTSDTTKDNNW
ncbi:MAG: KGG domain-containing protein [bacterium]